jgi:hypothetical protein
MTAQLGMQQILMHSRQFGGEDFAELIENSVFRFHRANPFVATEAQPLNCPS